MDERGNYDSGLLGVADYDQQLSNISLRAPGTCEWLAFHPSFSEWMRSGSSDVLWLRGYPGVGKSVITKDLIMSILDRLTSAPRGMQLRERSMHHSTQNSWLTSSATKIMPHYVLNRASFDPFYINSCLQHQLKLHKS